jgi:hypothetical protein
MNLKRLFIIHAIITFAAGIVLIVSPAAIPHTVDIGIQPDQNLLCYLLGAAELALAYLSFQARSIEDPKIRRLISMTFIVFHGSTAAVELLAFSEGTDSKILVNVFLRVIIMFLFFFYGIRKLKLSK